MTRYAHLSQRTVQVGQRVELGQLLGRVGRTGRATGVHLHYELVHNGKTIDPTRAFGQKLWAEHDRQSFSYR
jgi:murein DD-endopeptidase MepM/ murein hydrolase activator NlpD